MFASSEFIYIYIHTVLAHLLAWKLLISRQNREVKFENHKVVHVSWKLIVPTAVHTHCGQGFRVSYSVPGIGKARHWRCGAWTQTLRRFKHVRVCGDFNHIFWHFQPGNTRENEGDPICICFKWVLKSPPMWRDRIWQPGLSCLEFRSLSVLLRCEIRWLDIGLFLRQGT